MPIDHKATKLNQRLYFLTYCLCFVIDGFLLAFPGSIYITLQNQLHTTVSVISWIYTAMFLGYIVSSFICGCVMDYYKEGHRWQSLLIFITSICVVYVPFNSNIYIAYVLFILIGMGMGGNETNYTVFVFRLYPTRGSEMYFIACSIVLISASAIPLLIQLSVSVYSTYFYPFLLISFLGILHSLILLCLKTPKHDQYRSVKRNIASESIKNLTELAKASMILERTKKFSVQQNLIILLLIVSMFMHGVIETGLISYITVYTHQYLKIDDQIGRYLITAYWASELLYRIVRQIFFPNSIPIKHILYLGSVIRALVGFVFVFYGNSLISLIIIYILMGVCSSPIVPGLPVWSEMVKPTTGMISCFFMVAYGGGHCFMTAIMAELIDEFTISVLPYSIIIPLLIGLLFVALAVMIYKSFETNQFKVLKEIDIGRLSTADLKGADTETIDIFTETDEIKEDCGEVDTN